MTLYTELAATAQELLDEFGDDVTVTRKTGAYNSATRTRASGTGTQQLKGRLEAKGSVITNGERQYLYVAILSATGATFTPEAGHLVTAPEGTFAIDRAETVQGQGTQVVFELGLVKP